MSFASIFRNSARAAVAPAILLFIMLLLRPAAAAGCPHTLFLESTNGKYYVAVFAAPTAMKASLDITVFSKSSAYFASLAQISIEKPWKRSETDQGFRSYTALLANPGDTRLLGALVRTYGFPGDTGCAPEMRLIPSIGDVQTPPVPSTPAEAALESEVAREAGDGSNAFPVTPIPLPTGFPCELPFAAAKIVNAVQPRVDSPIAPLSTEAMVDLSASGAVTNVTINQSSGNADFDRAVIAAARTTTYSPMIFACVAREGRYKYRADALAGAGKR